MLAGERRNTDSLKQEETAGECASGVTWPALLSSPGPRGRRLRFWDSLCLTLRDLPEEPSLTPWLDQVVPSTVSCSLTPVSTAGCLQVLSCLFWCPGARQKQVNLAPLSLLSFPAAPYSNLLLKCKKFHMH